MCPPQTSQTAERYTQFFCPAIVTVPRHPWRGEFFVLILTKQKIFVSINKIFLKESFMKITAFFIIPLLLIIMGCALGGKAVVAEPSGGSPGTDLDAAIREAAAQMGDSLPDGMEVALVSVASSSAQLSEYVISRLEAALVSGKRLVVVDRANLDKVREEQGFQLSGEVDDNSAKAIGQLLGAGAIVTGMFTNLGDVYSLTLKAINIETATVAVSYPADIAKSTRIETLLASGGGAVGTQTAQKGSHGGNATPAPATPSYKIGDTGPGGGIVFYDKGSTSSGWRYMEVAAESLGKAVWNDGRFISGTDIAVGTGKQNTQLIVRSGGMAAMFCNAYRGGGFSDWFLPSKDEMNLIYINLVKIYRIADWQDMFWTSSEATNDGDAWSQSFSDGQQYGSNGNFNVDTQSKEYSVLAIRQF
jgi:hypothetical protein